MEHPITPDEARAALDSVDRGRRHVIDEIDLPRWYWFGLALGWIALGVVTDLDHPWLTASATLAFGAVHSAIPRRVVHGRQRSDRVSVRRELTGHQTALLLAGGVIGLGLLTVGGSLVLQADGARHPVTITSAFVAILIVLGGPRLLAAVRRRVVRDTAA